MKKCSVCGKDIEEFTAAFSRFYCDDCYDKYRESFIKRAKKAKQTKIKKGQWKKKTASSGS
jgi:rRNA maturation protein Nop10